jgi:hypothetical protein
MSALKRFAAFFKRLVEKASSKGEDANTGIQIHELESYIRPKLEALHAHQIGAVSTLPKERGSSIGQHAATLEPQFDHSRTWGLGG